MKESELEEENELLAHIPQKIKLKLSERKTGKLTEEENILIKMNRDYLEKKLWLWKKDNNFDFNLPPTIFSRQITIKNEEDMRYPNRRVLYYNNNIIGHHFRCEMLGQIWQTGQFTINSTVPDFPYTWKVAGWTVRGFQNLKYNFRKYLSISFFFLYNIKYRFNSEDYKEIFPLTFFSSIYHLYNSLYQSLNVIFGLPKYDDSNYEANNVRSNIIHQRLLNFIQSNRDLDYGIFKPETQNKLKKLDQEFEKKWAKEIQPSIIKTYNKQNLTREQMAENLTEDKKREYLTFLTENNKKFMEIEEFHPSAKDYLLSQQIINNASFYTNLEKEQKIENFNKEMEKHYIRNLCECWKNDKTEAFKKRVEIETKDEKEKRVKREIQNKKDPSIVYYYNTNNDKEVPHLVKEISKKKKKATKTYKVLRLLTKPYEVYQDGGYHLRREKYYEIKSSYCCWRIALFLVKLFCTIFNFNVVIYRQMIDSMFGIKALFCIELYRDYDIDINSGQFIKTEKTYTFAGTLKNLFIWIIESRRRFENAPDTGILGKCCTRIFHLFLNYILRLIFIGFILLLCYPLLIFFNVIICLFLMVFSPILIFFWNFGDYLFCVFIFNRYDEIFEECPLLQIIGKEFFYGFFFQCFACIFSIMGQPFISIFMFLLSIFYFIIRLLYDVFFFCIFVCLGRIPESNNCAAWMISGPGLFRERYYDIKNKDILILVIGSLEERILNYYHNQMINILDQPKNTIQNIQNIYQNAFLTYQVNSEITSNIDFYKNKLSDRVRSRRNLYPKCTVNVKFTKERIREIQDMIELFISEYARTNDISSELNKFPDKKVENLAKEIMIEKLGNHVFEPLQEKDQIVHLKSVFNNEFELIKSRLFENPLFDDKIYVEEEKKEKKLEEKIKIIRYPDFATFSQVFEGELNLDISSLDNNEKENLIKEDELLIIRT